MTPPRPSRKWPETHGRWILALASFAAFMSGLDLNIVRLAMPALSDEFHVGSSVVSWVQLIYILVLTCLLLVFGRLGDMWGYRRLFVAGLGLFTLASLAAALAPTISILLTARAIQAIGGAAMLALTTPIVSTFLPKAEQGRAIGIVAGCESLGITLGRLLGGLLIEYLNWRWIFLVNLPVGLAAIWVSLRVLPDQQELEAGGGFDCGGAVLFTLFLGPLLFALNMGEKFGWASAAILGTFAIAGLALAGFVILERRRSQPLLDLSLFAHVNLVLAYITSFVKFFIESGLYFLLPFYLMLARGMSADLAGLLLVAPAIVQMTVSPLTGRLTLRFGSRWVCVTSMAVTTLSCVLCYELGAASRFAFILLAIATIGLAKGLFIAPNRHRLMESAPPHKLGAVNGVLETMTRAGVALGICGFEAVFAAWLPEHGADYLHARAAVLDAGFRAAFLMGTWASLNGSSVSSTALAGGFNCSTCGKSFKLFKPKTCKNFFVVPYSTGRPSDGSRPAMRIKPFSMSCRRISPQWTPRTVSMSARMIGWR